MAHNIETDRKILIQKIPELIQTLTSIIDDYADNNNSRFPTKTREFFQKQKSPKIKNLTEEILSNETIYADTMKAFKNFLTISLDTPNEILSQTFNKKVLVCWTCLATTCSGLSKLFKSLCEISESIASGPSAQHHINIVGINHAYVMSTAMLSAELIQFADIIEPYMKS